MALTLVLQTSFAVGELSPALFGRVDHAKYKVALAKARNAYVDYRGGINNRAGTRVVNYAIDQSAKSRLIPFQYSDIQSYILEFSEKKMRVIRNGGYVLEPAFNIQHLNGVYYAPAHGLATGDLLSVSDVILPLRVEVLTVDTFQLYDFFDNIVVSAATTAARLFTLVMPWAAVDLPLLKFAQSFDTMTLTHPAYPPMDLTRTQHWIWTLTQIDFSTSMATPTSPTLTPSTTGDTGFGYEVTAVGTDGDESLPSPPAKIQAVNITATAGSIALTWPAVPLASKYYVYRTTPVPAGVVPDGVQYGYLGLTTEPNFTDGNIVPDFTKSPPQHKNPFADANYPGCAVYFQQCRVFGGSILNPQTLWFSKPGLIKNMDVSDPASDGDALTLTLASTRANNIKSMVSMPGGLVVLTIDGVWQVSGGSQYSAVKVSSAVAHPQSFNGASDVPPITIGYEILYVQSKGSIVRSLAYNLYTNTYQPADLTLFSSHLFAPHKITEWAYAEEPQKIIWGVRDDGKLLSFTYIKDQEVAAWCPHDTYGLVESIATVQEGTANVVYLSVLRPINGRWTRFIEQMQARDFVNVEDGWFVDCGLDTGLTTPSATLTLSGISGIVTGTTDADVFTSGMVGWVVRARGGIGTVIEVFNPRTVSIKWKTPVADYVSNGTDKVIAESISGAWSCTKPIKTVSGLGHLEGMKVSILADGSVITPQVVTGGKITLSSEATRVIIGLGYVTQLQTLPAEKEGGTVQGLRKLTRDSSIRMNNTRGIKIGPNFNELREMKELTPKNYNEALGVNSDDRYLPIQQYYSDRGQICLQQDYPLPMSVLMLVSWLDVGDQS